MMDLEALAHHLVQVVQVAVAHHLDEHKYHDIDVVIVQIEAIKIYCTQKNIVMKLTEMINVLKKNGSLGKMNHGLEYIHDQADELDEVNQIL